MADSTASKTSTDTDSSGFSDAERAAMKDRAQELKTERQRAKDAKAREKGEADLMAKIAEMSEPDQVMARRIHEIVTEIAPHLMPKTMYGMPAYAKDGKTVCFFQAASKFGTRYATIGFEEAANLDDGEMWPTTFALLKLTPAVEQRITELVRKAVSEG